MRIGGGKGGGLTVLGKEDLEAAGRRLQSSERWISWGRSLTLLISWRYLFVSVFLFFFGFHVLFFHYGCKLSGGLGREVTLGSPGLVLR